MRIVRKSLKLQRLDSGFYTPADFSAPKKITPTRLRRLTKILMQKVRSPAKAS